MSDMARAEAENQQYMLNYMVRDPTCQFNQQLADRGTEHALQKTPSVSKKVCVTRMPHYQSGPWESFVPDQPLREVRWEQWTRSKMPRMPGEVDKNQCLC
jgi:hypothetical protein